MIHLEFSFTELTALDYARYHHPHPQVQRKMEALYLSNQGLSHQEIRRLCRIGSKTALVSYLREYEAGGIEALEQLHYKGHPSQLSEHIPSLSAHFEAHPPRTSAAAQAEIERLTSIKRSPTQIKAFLKRIGLKARKAGYAPDKAAMPAKMVEQAQFQTEELEPRLAQAQAGERAVFLWMLPVNVHRAYLGFLWCFSRVFIASPSGRKRFNVLGVVIGMVNAITKEVIIVTNESYINAESICLMLLKLDALSLDVPITVVLDNARYQKCQGVFALAKALNIELLYLLSYLPHLNLIERLWKFVRSQCLYSKYYASFNDFKDAINTCIEQASTTHKVSL